jgi:hypothetical protein
VIENGKLPIFNLGCMRTELWRLPAETALAGRRTAGSTAVKRVFGEPTDVAFDELHELSPRELQLAGLVTTDAVADVLPENSLANSTVASLALARLVGSADDEKTRAQSTKTAEAAVPTGEVMAVAPAPK